MAPRRSHLYRDNYWTSPAKITMFPLRGRAVNRKNKQKNIDMLQTMEIKSDGQVKSLTNKTGGFTVDELMTAVNGISEVIPLESHKAYMVVNAEREALGLSVNSMASVIYEEQYGESAEDIKGDVLIAQRHQIDG